MSTLTKTRSARLSVLCDGCERDVSGSKKAVVHISHAALSQYKKAKKAFKEAHGNTFTLAQLIDEHPESVPWQIHCDDCNPHWVTHPDDGSRTACDGCYWFSLDRFATERDIIKWTAHLLGKNWLGDTNWSDFISRFVGYGL